MGTPPIAPFARSPCSDASMMRAPNPRRLLVITYHFPPDGSVGGLRWAGLTKYLARRGWEIEVITAAAQYGQPAERGVRVHHRRPRRTLNDVYKDWSLRSRARATGVSGTASPPMGVERGNAVIRSIRTSVSIALAFPDFGRGWILRAAWAARAALRARDFTAVITSGPPHSAHLAGAIACAGRLGLQWVDMRDPWAVIVEEGPDGVGRAKHWINRLIPPLERLVLHRAHAVLTNTDEFARALDAREPKLRVSYLPNGVDVERLPSVPVAKFPGLSISYAGTMYLGRDLTPVVHALKAFFATHPEARDAVKLRVAGSMDGNHRARFDNEVAIAKLTDAVEILGRIPPTEALDLINRSHLTLVLAQDQPVQIPAKLYECIALGVPTLVIAESSSAAAREARRVGAITHEPGDIDCIRQLLERLWSNPDPSIAPTAAISYDAIAAKLESLLLQRTAEQLVPQEAGRGVEAS
jgi:glycosyltransferase involved in cell wall biosynthesis